MASFDSLPEDCEKCPGGPQAEQYVRERQRGRDRRKRLNLVRPQVARDRNWGLALSGGGIRSATFCLGVLQGLAKSAAPSHWRAKAANSAVEPVHRNLLRQFDYLSTVSGGGYIGGFFGSLFVRDRLESSDGAPVQTNEEAAAMAFKVFESEPPGRLRRTVHHESQEPGRAALAWLRENGRYMAPTGSGDMLYAAALQIRNWFAVQWVIASILLPMFLLIAWGQALLVRLFGMEIGDFSLSGFRPCQKMAVASGLCEGITIWWSPVWWLLVPVVLLWLVPAGFAYWQCHADGDTKVEDSSPALSAGFLGAAGVAIVLAGMCWWLYDAQPLRAITRQEDHDRTLRMIALLGGGAGAMVIGCTFFQLTRIRTSITQQRVRLTTWFSTAILWLLVLLLLAVVDTLAQTLYAAHSQVWSLVTPAAVVGVLVWVARQATAFSDEKQGPSWMKRIPLNHLAGLVGVLLFLMIALAWAVLVQWLRWQGEPAPLWNYDPRFLADPLYNDLVVMGVVGVFLVAHALLLGQFPGFLNLSTLQGLYSARLTRAYLGASNGRRFEEHQTKKERRLRSVAEPAPGDGLTPEAYADNPLAPQHIVNVCLNQNIDPAEQLVQRDRKGKPLAILPGKRGNGRICIDGDFFPFPDADQPGDLYAPLSMGEWIGVSGAAVSTGMGRKNSLGYSLLTGLSNLRLGRWWASGQWHRHDQVTPWYDALVRWLFKSQSYLMDELFSRFHGTRREFHYLSDGGHFENTGLYELLRPQRALQLIVACDSGCDADYTFEDLANLIRLARIDFKAEVEVDEAITRHEQLGRYFGLPEHFRGPDGDNSPTRCALLLNVYHADDRAAGRGPSTRVVLLKPRLIAGLSADLAHYQSMRSAFPQEPTSDQFYDEAQWESYRKLGMEIACAVFGANDATLASTLWSYLGLNGPPAFSKRASAKLLLAAAGLAALWRLR
jgi:hypothetical protein